MFVVLSSLIGLFKKILEDKKEPLYGRINYKINLKPVTLQNSIVALKQLEYKNIEDMFYVYSIFGGFPKYYSLLEDTQSYNLNYKEVINKLFLVDNAPLENEVNDILKQEFGKRSRLYYSILFAIANGSTKLNEIATFTKTKAGAIIRYLKDLEQRFDIIKTVKPLNNKKSTKYYIKHPILKFWFKFIYSKFSAYNLKIPNQLLDGIVKDYDSYFGRSFEEISKDVLINLNTKKALPFIAEYISNWWGFKREDNQRKELEIDLILSELKEKTEFVNWKKGKRKEYYCIIAKSFKNKTKQDNLLLIDLEDIKKIYL
ncbi:MAG: DUF234 domain-containing protein [archaeon]|jgi:hypothetical protein